MHQYNLYQACGSKIELFSELIAFIGSSAGLPNNGQLVEKIRSLVDGSASTWVDEGLLIFTGKTLGKSPLFQRLWDAQFNATYPANCHRKVRNSDVIVLILP